MSETMTRDEVVEGAALAIVERAQRKTGEKVDRSFQSADAIVSEYTDDGIEQCRLLREAHALSREMTDGQDG